MYQMKDRLKALGKTQVWLIFQLREKGIDVPPPMMSNIVNGIYTYPKAKHIAKICNEIITEVENNGI